MTIDQNQRTPQQRYEITIRLGEDDLPQHVFEMVEHLLFELGEIGTLTMRSLPDDG